MEIPEHLEWVLDHVEAKRIKGIVDMPDIKKVRVILGPRNKLVFEYPEPDPIPEPVAVPEPEPEEPVEEEEEEEDAPAETESEGTAE